MTNRQQRRLQQKAERKAKKVEMRRQRQEIAAAAIACTDHVAPVEEEVCHLEQPSVESSEHTQEHSVATISERKLAANRANAQLSTGPTSMAGRQIVSQNRTRHGLTGSNFRVLAGESQAEFDQLLDNFLIDEAPADETEAEYVRQMAESMWLSRRSVRLQDEALMNFHCGDAEAERTARKDLALFMRYQTMHERAFIRYSTELRKHRNERRRAERGFESQKARVAQEARRDAAENRKRQLHELKLQRENWKNQRLQPSIPTAPESAKVPLVAAAA